MSSMEQVLRSMTFEFFGMGRHRITLAELVQAKAEKGAVLIDLRSRQEAEMVALKLSGLVEVIHIPINELPDRVEEIPKQGLVGLVCSRMTRSAMAYLYLRGAGYENVRIVEGGYEGIVDEVQPGRLMGHLGVVARGAKDG